MFNLSPLLAVKFECKQCDKIYLRMMKAQNTCYPNCSQCQKPVQVLGLIEAEDCTKYPIQLLKAVFTTPWHKLST